MFCFSSVLWGVPLKGTKRVPLRDEGVLFLKCTLGGSFKGYYKGSFKGSIGFRVSGFGVQALECSVVSTGFLLQNTTGSS